MESLHTSLENYHMNTVQQIAEHIDVALPKSQVRKAWLVRAVEEKIQEHAGSETYIQSLTSAERGALGVISAKRIAAPTARYRPAPAAGPLAAGDRRASRRPGLRRADRAAQPPPQGLDRQPHAAAIGHPAHVQHRDHRRACRREVAKKLPRDLLPFPEPKVRSARGRCPAHRRGGRCGALHPPPLPLLGGAVAGAGQTAQGRRDVQARCPARWEKLRPRHQAARGGSALDVQLLEEL